MPDADEDFGMLECGNRLIRQGLLSPLDQIQVERFRRFLQGERSHEIVAWALGQPMSSANDFSTYGMGC